MSDKRFRKRILEKIRSRYRLIIVNDTSYQTVFTLRLTPLKVFTILSLFSAFMIFLVIFLVASTPLKEYMPGYPKEEYREMLLKNVLVVDSLERELAVRDKYFEDFKTVIAGNIPRESGEGIQVSEKKEKGEFKRYNPDSIFEEKLLEERLNLSNAGGGSGGSSPERIHFYVPVKGMVSNKFNAAKNHYGIDIVAKQNSRIASVLAGTVIFAGFTTETGNVIYIQHENNLTSAYKHNAELLKKAGDRVSAGEAIAIIGNTGEQTTGPHLHFELWYSGKPIDPEKYIEF